MGKRKERSLKQKLEAVWQDNKCRSPNGPVIWQKPTGRTLVTYIECDLLSWHPSQKSPRIPKGKRP